MAGGGPGPGPGSWTITITIQTHGVQMGTNDALGDNLCSIK